MKKNIKHLALVAVLFLGIGYAAISAVTLTVNGTASATTNNNNFVVQFTNAAVSSGTVSKAFGTKPNPEGEGTVPKTTAIADYATAAVSTTDATKATLSIADFTTKGDKAVFTYTIAGTMAEDLQATLSIGESAVTNSNTEYFTITTALDKTVVKNGETATLTVTVELIKTPISAAVSADVSVAVTATPSNITAQN